MKKVATLLCQTNRPFPSCPLLLCQSESSCEIIVMKMRFMSKFIRLFCDSLKEQCHEDFAVLGQFYAKIVTLRLKSQTKCLCKATRKISNEFYQRGLTIIFLLEDFWNT